MVFFNAPAPPMSAQTEVVSVLAPPDWTMIPFEPFVVIVSMSLPVMVVLMELLPSRA